MNNLMMPLRCALADSSSGGERPSCARRDAGAVRRVCVRDHTGSRGTAVSRASSLSLCACA